MMEADLYDKVNEALQQKSRKVVLPVSSLSGVDRIVWSVWDYIMGPELKFVWEIVPLNTGSHSEDENNSSFGVADSSFDEISVDDNKSNKSPFASDQNLDSTKFFPQSTVACASIRDELMESSQSTLAESEHDVGSPDRLPLAGLKLNPQPESEYKSNADIFRDNNNIEESSPALVPLSQRPSFGVIDDDDDKGRIDSQVDNANVVVADNNSDWSQRTDDTGINSDNHYVAVHTLSSEIYRSHFGDTLDFKLICVPERHLTVAAYVFAAKHRNAKARHSISLLMNDKRLKWFLKLKTFCRSYFDDLVPRLKAAALVESYDELLSRMSTEFTQLLNVMGILEQNSFEAIPFQVSDSYLSKANLADDDFLKRCIGAHLQCKGHIVILGNESKKINKMLKTLAFFEPRENWILCKFASKSNNIDRYCPYLKLQGYSKSELSFITEQAVYSNWPVCIIDVDTEMVLTSLPLFQHFSIKNLQIQQDLQQIVGKMDINTSKFHLEFQTSNYQNDIVQPFLTQMDFLPYDNHVRESFLNQFLRYLGHKALSLDVFAKSASESGNNRKSLKLSKLRKALDLQMDGNFMMVLATADRLRPGLAKFIVKKE